MQLIGKLTTCSIWVLSDFIDTHFRATQFNGTAHVHAPRKSTTRSNANLLKDNVARKEKKC